MQRLVYLCTGTSRLFRVVGVNYLENSKALFEKENLIYNTNHLISKRWLATKNIDTHPDLYKPSTAKQETHVPDDLKGGQTADTIDTAVNSAGAGAGDGKVWSAQNQGNIHIAPLGRVNATTFVPSSKEDPSTVHETTIYTTTKGEVNVADPFKTHGLKPEASPAQLAEAAAASAFEAFAPDTPLAEKPSSEAVFAPKISSTDTYSTTTSPTANFETTTPPSSSQQQEHVVYKASNKPKVFGGQDTTADTKKHSKRNPFNLQEKIIPGKEK